MRRILIPLIFGLAGAAVLVSLGVWQVQRLAWKEAVLAEIDARIAAAPAPVPGTPDPAAHRYMPVEAEGYLGPRYLRVLVSRKKVGAGYRLITGLTHPEHGAMLVDLGFVKVDAELPVQPAGPVAVLGNLHWPDDRNSSTPANDEAGNTWFARDLERMAEVLGTEPILLVVREMSPGVPGVTPLPIDSSGIPNDHLQYAITWFSLAAIWVIMTGTFLWRQARPSRGPET